MKTQKSLIVLLLLTVSMAASAQTTLKEAFKAYMQTNPSASTMDTETIKLALGLMNIAVLEDYDEATSEQLIDKYIKESFEDDLIDVMLPIIEDKVNVKELNELTAMFKTTRGKSYEEHWAKVSDSSQLEQLGDDAMDKISDGLEPTPIEPISCPAKYKNLFMQFYKEIGQDEILIQTCEALGNTFGDAFGDDQKPMMDKYSCYLLDNYPTMLLNESYGTMTEDDLKFGIELGKTQAWKNQVKAMTSILPQAKEMGMSIAIKYISWLQDQGVETKM